MTTPNLDPATQNTRACGLVEELRTTAAAFRKFKDGGSARLLERAADFIEASATAPKGEAVGWAWKRNGDTFWKVKKDESKSNSWSDGGVTICRLVIGDPAPPSPKAPPAPAPVASVEGASEEARELIDQYGAARQRYARYLNLHTGDEATLGALLEEAYAKLLAYIATLEVAPTLPAPSVQEAVEAERRAIIHLIREGKEIRVPSGDTEAVALDEEELIALIEARGSVRARKDRP